MGTYAEDLAVERATVEATTKDSGRLASIDAELARVAPAPAPPVMEAAVVAPPDRAVLPKARRRG